MNPQHNAPLSRHLPSQAQRVPFLRRQCDKSRGRCNWLLQASKLDTQQLQHVAEQAADAGTKVNGKPPNAAYESAALAPQAL